MCDSKLVIVSETGYNPKYDSFLQSLPKDGCERVCFVGKGCKKWADRMQQLAGSQHIRVSSHAGEDVDAVVALANAFRTRNNPDSDADIIYL